LNCNPGLDCRNRHLSRKRPTLNIQRPTFNFGKNCDYPITQCISLDPESNMQGQCPSALMIRLARESLIGGPSRFRGCDSFFPPPFQLQTATTRNPFFLAKRRRQSVLIRKGSAADASCFAAAKFHSTRSLAKLLPATLAR